MSQIERVYAHLQIRGSITNAEAHNLYGIRHLPAVIRDIKKRRNVNITDEWETGQNRYSEKCRWKIYHLEEKEKVNA